MRRVKPIRPGDELAAHRLNAAGGDTVRQLLAQGVGTLDASQPFQPTMGLVVPVLITQWEVFSSNAHRWKYGWKVQAAIVNDAFVDHRPTWEGFADDNQTYALNLAEFNNTNSDGPQGNSVNASGTDYPAGFDLKPVGAGSNGTPSIEVPVLMTWWPCSDNKMGLRPIFQYENADDGTCT